MLMTLEAQRVKKAIYGRRLTVNPLLSPWGTYLFQAHLRGGVGGGGAYLRGEGKTPFWIHLQSSE